MPKDLERDLGLPSVMAISIGAMVGSGIFILPGLALDMAGPAVVLAYAIAGLLVLPAALSKSEMATAMPEAGGTYIYIERGMGPLLGTVAGVGTWFSLTFKGALALVGGAPYLVLLFDLPVKPVALGAAAVLIAVNLVGVKQTGRLQIAIVVVMLAAMSWLVLGGTGAIEPVRYEGFLAEGAGGILAATGFVYVSYAGVTKIASVAEEIENPDRNIPLGMLGSLAFTTLLYVGLVAVMVGVVPTDDVAGSSVPMALAAERTLANPGVIAVVVAAVLALVSTANAGILSSSRYPFAMSRDGLAPAWLNDVHDRFHTPSRAITLTGAVLLFMVAFVPIEEIAKLASAFKILVFVLVNVALVAFREADLEDYDPSFESPLYPLPQAVGIVGGLALLPLMGLVPLAGAVVITAGSLAWYYAYVRGRGDVEREGVAADTMRRALGRRAVAEAESAVAGERSYELLVAVTETTPPETEETLLTVGTTVARARGGGVRVVRFDEVPDQVPLETAAERVTPDDVSFEDRIRARVPDADVPIEYGEVVSHDSKHAIVNRAATLGVDAVLLERRSDRLNAPVFASEVEWIERHAPCDVIEVEDRGLEDVGTLAVVSDRGPYDSIKIVIADAIATETGAAIELLFAIEPSAPAQRRETVRGYFEELEALCNAPVTSRLVEAEDPVDGLTGAASDVDLLVVSSGREGVRGVIFDRTADRIVDGSDCTALLVHPESPRGGGMLRRFVANRLF